MSRRTNYSKKQKQNEWSTLIVTDTNSIEFKRIQETFSMTKCYWGEAAVQQLSSKCHA